jgi:C-terminal processing protease CtpA/Prc
MSVSFWKMSPGVIFLGGRAEAEWLTKNFTEEVSEYFSKVSISKENIAEAEKNAAERDETLDEKIFTEKMLKTLTDMLEVHTRDQMLKRIAKGDDSSSGGYDWFDIEISW